MQTGEIFDYTAPEEVQHEMDDLMEWYRKTSPEFHSLVVSALLHYRFVRIHPFDDGNGRVARLLMNYHLLSNDFPPVVIKSADKKNYLIALQRADEDDFEAFAAYIAEQLLWSLDLNIKAAERKNLEEQGDWEKELAILEKTLKKDDEVQPASNELIYKRVNDSLIPLYQKVSEKVIEQIFGMFYKGCSEND
ncbi:MAG: Fic family protein [Lewinellaceae bacterium]|nr:Fic family protein [Lewinellaceae bacterium]